MYANEQPRESKRSMLAALHTAPASAELAARNTLDYTLPGGTRKIRLHKTDILTISPNGSFTIDTQGWGTVTTRDRLNTFLPSGYRVSCSKGRMHLNGQPFLNTISVSVNGVIRPDLTPAADERLSKQIDAYMKAWRMKGLPRQEDSRGDPWIFTPGKVDESVMLDWMKSKYVFRLLYILALRYAGLTECGIAFYLQSADQRGLDKTDYRRIRRYIRACLGMVA